MSRVRVLNLPRDCTEDQLRRHLLASLPPSAPHLEITDCVIKRSHASGKGRSVIRMAFVGFRSASSGHFIVRHFDSTYFGSAKLRVEVAKGLGDVGLTTNKRKKMEAAGTSDDDKNAKGGGKALKRPRDEAQQPTAAEHEDAGVTATEEDQQRRKKERKEEFIAERMKVTSCPTWTSQVLVPESAAANDNDNDNDDNTHTVEVSGTDYNAGEDEVEDAEEAERQALERQQALGEVSDLDFLASLANKAGATCGNRTSCRQEGAVDEAGGNVHEESTEENEKKGETSGEQQRQLSRADDSQKKDEEEAIVHESRRIRLGNIPYIATEDDVKQFASSLVGTVEAVHIPLTKDTRQSKGAVFVKFVRVEDAVRALSLCHGAVFMGRLLRVSAAADDPYTKRLEGRADAGAMAGNSEFKRQKEQERRSETGSAMVWNTMYMNSHTAVESVAKRLGVAAGDVVSVQARGAAVRAAIAEAYLTTEIQRVLSDEGIDFGLLESAQQNLLKTRSYTTILVKNIQTTDADDAAELSKMFLRYGSLEATAFPSAGGFALFRYTHQQDARVAFQRLSYKLFKNAPLFLEWAPIGAIVIGADDEEEKVNSTGTNETAARGKEVAEVEGEEMELPGKNAAFAPVFTLFITNIPFTSKEEEFYVFLLDTCPRLAKLPEKYIERLAFEQDKGRAFLTLKDQSTFKYVQQRLNGKSFARRTLACVPSKQTTAMLTMKTASSSATLGVAATAGPVEEVEDFAKASAVVARRAAAARGASHVPPGCDALKLVVKNVPFEATEKDIRDLFSAFSEIRSVRLPRKSHQFSSHRENNHRGFAFVEFLSEEEAKRAMETLKATHLYGRHLVLQYAKLDGQ
ncbi:hypothetical protein TraAM80_01808 [Trypanosoma rangeli]|uniref:RRM domain-containing protein n=1 Tax=Trypanosoma rangeli TaxID=5698 RepID=A0A3R7NQE9_TRYRA|nr:uncharacterized protein TraAM80_01808 [Trypanosoma rangeli]RNF09969.1 hypothetical protein TraAM80_01808 [Trypanosoma rangeli]|eukprot:RNF09969.1 hypothetical protein TraAM80_01808 [Trypanosoma rangeli]